MAKPIAPATPMPKRGQHRAETGKELRLRQEQAAIVEEDAARNDDAVAHFGQRLEHGVVPEKELQQQRDVADGLDIAAGEFRHQPILRQPRDADDEADDGGEDDAEPGHQQRIEQPDPEGAAIGRGLRVEGDQRLADVEAGGGVPEAEAGGDVGAVEMIDGVADRAVDQEGNDRAEHDLIEDAADLGVVVERDTRGACARRKVGRHGSPRRAAPAPVHVLLSTTAAGPSADGAPAPNQISGSAARIGCRPCPTDCSSRG